MVVWGSENSEGGSDVVEVGDAGESDMADARKTLKMVVSW